jgi:hypothetical protein
MRWKSDVQMRTPNHRIFQAFIANIFPSIFNFRARLLPILFIHRRETETMFEQHSLYEQSFDLGIIP